MKKVEYEISKVRKEMLKIMYPTWDESFNSLSEEQLRLFASILDSKFDACNQKMNMLQGDVKGKAKVESNKIEKPITPHFASNSSNYYNLMQNNMPQAQIFHPLMNTSDKNNLVFWQSSPMFVNAQGSYQRESPNKGKYMQSYPWKQVDANSINWADQVDGNVIYDSKIDMKNKDEAENDQNLSPYYYNGNTLAMQSYPIAMQNIPFQNLQNLPQGFQFNGYSDMDILQAHMLNYMDGRK
ncbi:uncharacterized protein [Cicer arietinum]|uniref:uncharacterized protein n=1 Tax=Cicer arietinum TaxID=3827 RepID=UPI003CC5A2C6